VAASVARPPGSRDLFRARLDRIIEMKHEPVRFAGKIDGEWRASRHD
jgi:hypothetical protein